MAKAQSTRWGFSRSILAATVVVACWAQVARAQALDHSTMAAADVELLADYEAYDSRCRGNSGDDPQTWVACGARDYIGFLLNRSGYCYGQTNQAEDEMIWQVCSPKSNRFEKP